jgi:hypothetical protein
MWLVRRLPKKQQVKGKTGRADQVLSLIQQLYRVEKESEDYTVDHRYEIRKKQPKGIPSKLRKWLDKAIDNNRAENSIRPFVIDRKNWLFSASQKGAKSSANLYSIIDTAKTNGLEPNAYLKLPFTQLPSVETLEDIDALLS